MKFKILDILLILLAFAFAACSSDKDNSDVVGGGDKKVAIKICMDWGASRADIENYMPKNYKVMAVNDENTLVFADAKETHTVSYEFVDDHLRASLLSYLSESPINTNKIFNTGDYKYIGHADGAAVYTNDSQNTMCTIMERLNGNAQSQTLYGFTPMNSTYYDNFDPITVTLGNPTMVATLSAKMNASFAGVNKIDAAYFVVSLSADFKSVSRYKATTSGCDFYANISVAEPNSTVYYYAEIQIDGVWYQSDAASLEMPKVKLYAIGDPYPNNNNPIGVVCAIKNSGMNGTIISLDQDYLKWDTSGIFCTDYSAYNSSDGSLNKIGTSLPFAKWIAGHGSGWFGPAKYQLSFNSDDLKAINKGLREVGGKALDGFYWSSTQKDNNNVWVMTVTESSYMGYANKYSFYHNKDNSNSARAMKYF